MRVCAALAARDGHCVIPYESGDDCARSLIQSSQVLVLPVPASRDGVHISGTELLFSSLPLPKDLAVFGGFIPASWKNRDGIYDCAAEEPFTWANASLTAEGGIASALSATGRGFYGMRIAVLGFGRIAKLLLCKLSGFGVPITVYARRAEAIAEASLCGHTARPLDGQTVIEEDIIFNTVPAAVFAHIRAPRAVYCCDLGGGMPAEIDKSEGEKLTVTAARGVPGVFAPTAAGEIIYRSLSAFLETIRPPSSPERSDTL